MLSAVGNREFVSFFFANANVLACCRVGAPRPPPAVVAVAVLHPRPGIAPRQPAAGRQEGQRLRCRCGHGHLTAEERAQHRARETHQPGSKPVAARRQATWWLAAWLVGLACTVLLH
jgi:hypothetical protein